MSLHHFSSPTHAHTASTLIEYGVVNFSLVRNDDSVQWTMRLFAASDSNSHRTTQRPAIPPTAPGYADQRIGAQLAINIKRPSMRPSRVLTVSAQRRKPEIGRWTRNGRLRRPMTLQQSNAQITRLTDLSLDASDSAVFEQLDAENKRTVSLTPLDRPHDEVVSNVTQSILSSRPHMQMGSVTSTAANTDKEIKPDHSPKTNVRIRCQLESMFLTYHFMFICPTWRPFFAKAIYCVRILIIVTPKRLDDSVDSLNMGVGPNLIKEVS